MTATPASPDFCLLSFTADAQALAMLFSNGTVQVSEQHQRSDRGSHCPSGSCVSQCGVRGAQRRSSTALGWTRGA